MTRQAWWLIPVTLLTMTGLRTLGDEPAKPLYEEDVAASDPLRVEQAEELGRYLDGLRDSRAALDTVFRPDYSSPVAYIASTEMLRQKLRDRIGYPPPGQPGTEEPTFSRVGEDDGAVYHRFKIAVLPNVHAIGLYIVPMGQAARLPLVIAMHGGGGSPEVATFHGGANYHDLVRGAVARGYAVFAIQHLYSANGMPGDIRQQVDSKARLVGTTITAIEIAKLTRGLDVILKRPEIDPDRVAMVGLSYGGFYTLFTTALEPRIKVAVASCPYGDRAEHFWQAPPGEGSDRRFPDGASLLRDSSLAALICPRPLEYQVGLKDTLFPVEEYRKQAGPMAEPYRQLGLPERFRFVEFDGTHEFHGEAAWDFVGRHL